MYDDNDDDDDDDDDGEHHQCIVVVPRNDVFADDNGRDERLGFVDTFLTGTDTH